MDKTTKRIGIAFVAVLLVALVCAGIALALPSAETPLVTPDETGSVLSTELHGVDNQADAMAYYNDLVSQGYYAITSQAVLNKWINSNGSDANAKAALMPYNGSSLMTYTFGTSGAHYSGVFKATIDACGAQITMGLINFSNSDYKSEAHTTSEVVGTSDTTMFDEFAQVWWYGSLANIAQDATIKNAQLVISSDQAFIGSGTASSPSYTQWNSTILCGGLFGAMSRTTIDNCSLTITADILGAKKPDGGKTINEGLVGFGGLAGYCYDCVVSNSLIDMSGSIYVTVDGVKSGATSYGSPRSLAAGMIAVSQGLNAYNIVAKGSGDVISNTGVERTKENGTFGNAGLIVALDASSSNGNAGTGDSNFGLVKLSSVNTTVDGVLTQYTGTVQQRSGARAGFWDGWPDVITTTGTGVLAGSIAPNAITNIYTTTTSLASATFGGNQTFGGHYVSASVVNGEGTATIHFGNDSVDSLTGLQVTYTAPSASGSILWSYHDSGSTTGDTDTHSAKPYETYTVTWPRGLTADRSVSFTTGRKVKYTVSYEGSIITDLGGMDAEPVKTKQFDNTAYSIPTLNVWSLDMTQNLGDQTEGSYWGIFLGELTSSWETAVDVGIYNVRLTDAFNSSTAYDFVDNTRRYIAYKSDNSNGASRNYRFEITPRVLSLNIPAPSFVYDGTSKPLTFNLTNTVASDNPQPSVVAQYYNSSDTEIDVNAVVNAGEYSVSVTGINDSNYVLDELSLASYADYSFSIAKRPITITPSGYSGLTYNGNPQYPSVVIGNRVSENDNQVVNLNYYGEADLNKPLNEDERINAGNYQMRAELADINNYVLDNSALEEAQGVSFTDTSVTIDYSIAKADLKFVGSPDGTYTFVYSAQPVTTLAALNRAIGGEASPTQYYFQPVDPTNTEDVNVGESGARWSVTKDGVPVQMMDTGTYDVVVVYDSSSNFNKATTSFQVVVTPRELVLNFTQDPSNVFTFQYGETVTDYAKDQPQGAQPDDELIFGTVYYKDFVSSENKLDEKPTAVGNYVASYQPTGTSLDIDVDVILGNYTIAADANSTIQFEITKRDVSVTYAGIAAAIYDGEQHQPVTVASIEGVIDSEKDLYTPDTLKAVYTLDDVTTDYVLDAGTYYVTAVPKDDQDVAFANNYNITIVTYTVDKAVLELQLLDYPLDYSSAVGQDIPYVEGGTFNTVKGQIFGDDNVDENGNYLLDLYIVNSEGAEIDVIDSLGTYAFSVRLNSASAKAGNYDLVLLSSEGAAAFPNRPAQAGTIIVSGTPVIHGIDVIDTDGEIISQVTASGDGYTYDVTVPYRAGDVKIQLTATSDGASLNGIAFEQLVVEDSTSVGVDAANLPYFTVRNAASYTATITIATDLQGMFYFADPQGGSSEVYSLTVNVTVTPLDVNVEINDASVVYGGEIVYGGYTLTGDEDGSVAAALAADNAAFTYACSVASTENVGVYEDAVTVSRVTFVDNTYDTNYNFNYVAGALVIDPKPVTVNVTPGTASVVYGDAMPSTFTVSVADGSALVGDDNIDAAIAEKLQYVELGVGTSYPSFADGDNVVGNYAVTLVENTGAVQITPKSITIEVANGKMPYGAGASAIRPAEDGVYYLGTPEFAYDDAPEFAYRYVGTSDLASVEPGTDILDSLELQFVDETMGGNYNVTYVAGDLTVEAMIIAQGDVEVVLDSEVYTGGNIGYQLFVDGVNVSAADPTRLVVELSKDGEPVADKTVKDAGEYVFVITGDGEYYQGEVTVTVNVEQAQIPDISLDKTNATYSGQEITVSAVTDIAVQLAITDADGQPAQLVNAGVYTVTITSVDPNYVGSVVRTFEIVKATHPDPVEGDLTIEVSWDKVTVTADGYTVELTKDATGQSGWVDTTMSGYEASSPYVLTVRYKEDANHFASGTIQISGVTAERAAVEFTVESVEEHYDSVVVTIEFADAFDGEVQYSVDGGESWHDFASVSGNEYTIEGLDESTEYSISVRIPESDDYLASDVVSFETATGVDPAKFNETLASIGETFTAADLTKYQTLVEQYNALTEADKAGVDAQAYASVTAQYEAFVAGVNDDIADAQGVAAKAAGKAAAAAAAAVVAAAIALFVAKRKFI